MDLDADVVINYDLPLDSADYPHRCGRTGRNGNKGLVITFIDFDDHENYSPSVIHQIAKVCYTFLLTHVTVAFQRFVNRPEKEVPWLLKREVENARARMESERNEQSLFLEYEDHKLFI